MRELLLLFNEIGFLLELCARPTMLIIILSCPRSKRGTKTFCVFQKNAKNVVSMGQSTASSDHYYSNGVS